ncbi:restriction endonuclease subunit S [Latilactobacillus curvatus]|uniref:restriction endonuclease subunit S n=1 Tax=Latilactobacillus curvatus TaxID=28038 RepID=UPI000DAAF218|nr:restriction endonuclease subunit S [Latilactobacillus curvatus]AWV73876.1 restriction endonuclease subunit S [Latilactobacillus curvatus]
MKDKPAKYPQLRFKGFTDSWVQRKVSETAEVNPKTTLPDEFEYVDLGAVVGTSLNETRHEFKVSAPSRAQRLASVGDVFYQTVRPYQKNNYLFENAGITPFVFSTGYAQLRPQGDSYFLLTLLQGENFVSQVMDRSTGTSYPAINSSDLGNMHVDVPTEAEQVKIGSLFKSLDNLIAANQRKLDLLKEQKKGYLQKMFPKNGVKVPELRFAGFADDWEERKLLDIADRFDNLRVPITASNRKSGDTPYYGANGIQDYVEGFTHDGEFILVAEDGANDLKNYPVQYVDGKVWVNNHAHVLQGKKTITDNKFLMNSIKNFDIEPFLVGGGRAKLNADVMMKLNILLPTFEEQEQIGSFFSLLDKTIALHQRKLDLLKEQKKGFLQKMFV